jgi:hypothetical protein
MRTLNIVTSLVMVQQLATTAFDGRFVKLALP